jgi:hypothetical protein
MIIDNTSVSRTNALLFTRVTNAHGPLTKTFKVNADDPNGKPTSMTAAKVYEGTAETIAVANLHGFVDQLRAVGRNQAFAYGVTGHDRVDIVKKSELDKRPGAIARGRKHFHFRKAPGIWMLDHDAGYLPKSYDSSDELRGALIAAVPSLAYAPMLWTPSASTYIVNEATRHTVKGAGGARIYIPVDDASDVPRAVKALREHLWAAGIGEYSVSRSGQLLERTLIDLSTAQPERLDFVAGADCVKPLAQRRPDPVVFEAEMLGGVEPCPLREAVPDASRDVHERAEEQRQAAKARVAGERQRVRQAYHVERVAELVQAGVPEERASETITRALDQDQLFAEFVLYPEGGGAVTVGEVLDDPKRWHGTRFADPLEPEYGNDPRIAFINLRGGGRPYIFSHAHGGKRYELFRQPTVLEVRGGDAPRLTDACVELMSMQQQVFDGPADGMLRVGGDGGGRLYPVTAPWLSDHLGRIATFQKYDARSKAMRAIDVPPVVTAGILGREGDRGLPRLVAVVTAPTLRADGSVLDVPGYDAQSELLYLSNTIDVPRVNPAPKRDEVVQALRALWQPLSQFPFDGPVSRSVALAALLTSCVRRGLSTAPGFAYDAPAPGSGKTLLAQCNALLGGHSGETTPLPGTEEERRKTIFAMLRAGVGCLTFDNVSIALHGDALDQALTAPLYSSRVLGESRSETVPNRAMVQATGNNLQTRGDSNRRWLRCRINAGVERPYQRQFDFNPAQVIQANRLSLVAAALTVIRGYLTAAPQKGSLASFEEWDGLVRHCVLWCRQLDVLDLGDPLDSILEADEADTSKGAVVDFLSAWRERLGEKPRTAAEVLAAASEWPGDGAVDLGAALRCAVRADSRRLGEVSRQELGDWLSARRDVMVSGLRLARTGIDRNKVALWSVTAAEP